MSTTTTDPRPVSAPPRPTSAPPTPEPDLLGLAVSYTLRCGEIPSLRALMRELHIGSDRARAVRGRLEAIDWSALYEAQAEADLGHTRADDDGVLVDEPAALPVRPVAPGDGALVDEQRPTPPQVSAPNASAGHTRTRKPSTWPAVVIALPAMVAIWTGWVGLGELTGFGPVHPLPGIWDALTINSAITLPVGMEAYGMYAMSAWLRPSAPAAARTFGRASALVALVLGMCAQAAYHLMAAAGWTRAPWPVTVAVSCLPVAVAGMGAALRALLRTPDPDPIPVEA